MKPILYAFKLLLLLLFISLNIIYSFHLDSYSIAHILLYVNTYFKFFLWFVKQILELFWNFFIFFWKCFIFAGILGCFIIFNLTLLQEKSQTNNVWLKKLYAKYTPCTGSSPILYKKYLRCVCLFDCFLIFYKSDNIFFSMFSQNIKQVFSLF